MTLNRITSISRHRLFREFQWPSDLDDFKKFNLIYGWNGSGKSTLGRIFRCLETQTNVSEGSVVLRWNGHDFTGADFSTRSEHVRVFNDDFVAENVFTAQNEVSPIFVIGKSSIEKQQELEAKRKNLDDLTKSLDKLKESSDKASKAKDDLCKSEARTIKEAIGAHGNQYTNYNKRTYLLKANALLEVATASKAVKTGDQKKALQQQARTALKPTVDESEYALPAFESLLAQVKEIGSRSVVAQAIDELTESPKLANWVRTGLELHEIQRDRCGFCSQPLSSERIQALNRHFSTEFQQLSNDISDLLSLIDTHEESLRSFAPPKKAELFDDIASGYDALLSELYRVRRSTTAFFDELRAILDAKSASPFDILPAPVTVTVPDAAPGLFEGFKSHVGAHNVACRQFDERVNAALIALEESYVAESLDRYRQLVADEDASHEQLESARSKIPSLRKDIQRLERDIISHRKPAEQLNRQLQDYLGHSDLQFEVQETGYRIIRKEEIATDLSEGEKTAIALLYFLRRLDAPEFDRSSGLVVLDDPVSSLDSNALFNAFAYVKDHTIGAHQVVLLTHNFGFFRAVREWFRNLRGQEKKEWRIFMLSTGMDSTGRYSVLGEIDPLLKKFESEYHFLFAYVHRIAQAPVAENLEEYLAAPTIARRVLETFLAFRFPDGGSLHSKMDSVDCENTVRSRIYRFVNTHAHRDRIGEQDDDLTILSETKSVLNSLIEFMRTADREHVDRMIDCIQDP
ncbi:MAG: AAA family ATPase [Candidatus Paceibacterota bacterium]